LLSPQQCQPQRLEFCHVVGKPASAADALALASDELHAALSDLEVQLARGGGPGEVRLTGDGELVIPPLTAEDVPAEAEALRDELGALLPRVPLASVLVEIDARTGFHRLPGARGREGHPPGGAEEEPAVRRRDRTVAVQLPQAPRPADQERLLQPRLRAHPASQGCCISGRPQPSV
jgi:hypothetical protein